MLGNFPSWGELINKINLIVVEGNKLEKIFPVDFISGETISHMQLQGMTLHIISTPSFTKFQLHGVII